MQRENRVEPDQVVGYETNHLPKGYLAEWQQWVNNSRNKKISWHFSSGRYESNPVISPA
jgi:hypothetical protein